MNFNKESGENGEGQRGLFAAKLKVAEQPLSIHPAQVITYIKLADGIRHLFPSRSLSSLLYL